jgi:signal peptidase I
MFLDLSRELLGLGHRVRFRPAGNSMHPTIRDGETVTVEPVEAAEVRLGDIILHVAGRGLTAHRVVRIEERSRHGLRFILRGDAMNTCDAPVRPDQVLGRIVSVERRGRSIKVTGRKAKLARAARERASRIKARINLARSS